MSDDEIIDACYDYETYKPLFFKFAPERVYESKFVEDLEELKRQLSAKYGLKDWQIGVADFNDVGVEQAALIYKHPNALELIIPDVGKNLLIIDRFMDARGYKLIVREIENKPEIPETIVHLIYVPKIQNDVRADIVKDDNILYHLAPKSKVELIKKNGLMPRSREGKGNIFYEPRIYFFKSNTPRRFMKEYAIKTLSPESGETEYYRICIDIDKLADYVKFYYDPLLSKQSVFTTYAIPADAIDSIEKI